ncbi:hypothetical protein Q1695_015553 [Nippostrongylus brasiliensis]|nr:hypothetical protein Q1695_015553 [Nippostrongylus brasiliensis]
MRVPFLLSLLVIAYCQQNSTAAPDSTNGTTGGVSKISRDVPRTFIANDQGSISVPFPAIARIRAKHKLDSSVRTKIEASDTRGVDRNVWQLMSSLEHSKSGRGAFSRKTQKTGSSFSPYSFSEYAGEPYLNGYRGIPDTHTSSGDGPNYMGALTKTNKAGKHTFGSYGSIDSEKAQIWQPHPTGSSGATYGEIGVIVIASLQHEELHLPL